MTDNANSNYFTFRDFAKIKSFPKANVNVTQIVPAQDPDIKMPNISQGYEDSPLLEAAKMLPQ